MQLATSLNSALGDLAIQTPNAEAHPLVLTMKELARTAALQLDEVVINCVQCICRYINMELHIKIQWR